MFKRLIILFIFNCYALPFWGQDSTLVGQFSAGLTGSYSLSNITDEQEKGGFGLQLRYFPNPKFAFVFSYNNTKSTVERFAKISTGRNASLGFGFEKHFLLNNFRPYIGLEAGLNFTTVKSALLKLASNEIYFQNHLPNYLFKPKFGLAYTIRENLFLTAEGAYFWVISPDRANTNPLYDDSYTAIYFGRKLPTFSLGIHYLFKQ